MKKLLLILTVLACGIGQVRADNVTFRIYAERQFYDGWGDNVKVYVNYWDGSQDVLLIDNQSMTYAGQSGDSYHMFYADLTVDEAILNGTYGVKVKFNNGSGTWTATHSEIKDFTTKNYIFYIYNDNGIKQSYGNYTFKIAKSGDNVLSDIVELTPTNNVLTTIVDNEESITEAWYVLYPSFATERKTTAQASNCINWNLVIRPSTVSGNYDITNFNNYNGILLHNGGTGLFYVNSVQAKNLFTFDLSAMTFTVAPYFTRTISALGYATFSADYAVAIPDGVSAYYASSADAETDKVTMTKFTNGIAKNTGAMLYKEGGGEVTFTPATTTDDVATTNLLKPTTGSAIYDGGKAQYILSKEKAGDASTIAFRKLTSTNSSYAPAKGSAYLEVASDLAPSLSIVFDGEDDMTTGINASLNDKAEMINDKAVYNLAGQRVSKPTKGLYIVNGKKVVIK